MQRCLAFSALGIVFGAYLKDFSIPSLRCFSYLSAASEFQITYASCFWLYRNPLLVRWVMSCERIFLTYIGNSYHLPPSYSFPYVGKVLGLWETEFLPLPPLFLSLFLKENGSCRKCCILPSWIPNVLLRLNTWFRGPHLYGLLSIPADQPTSLSNAVSLLALL